MASPWRAIAFVAGVAAASAIAAADPAPAAKSGAAKAAPGKAAKPARSTKGTKSAKAAKPAKASKVAKSSKSSRSRKPAKTAKAAKSSKSWKSAKPSKSAKSKSGARVAAARGVRGDNMPRGFAWPATPGMRAASKTCEADLDALGVTWKRASAEGRMVDPIEVPDGMLGGIKYTSKWRRPPHKLDCQLARALAQVGRDLHAVGVREVRWSSIYRWSNVRTRGRELPFLSRHALGLAMDIYDFVDDAGRVVNVQQHYGAGDPLLAAVEQVVNASGKFRIVLTPKNDPQSHDDHFHVEANPDYTAP